MASVGRLILRFIVVPFGMAVATLVGILVLLIGQWTALASYAQAHPESDEVMGWFFLSPLIGFVLIGAAVTMLAPAVIGVLVAEFFAIRSWIFHIANGVVSAWVGWSVFVNPGGTIRFMGDVKLVLLTGLLAGVIYWVIAGWSAGFWKPVFGPAPPPRSPPAKA
jgi:hypothetical protein